MYSKFYSLFFIALLLSVQSINASEIIKSPNDNRQYQSFTLANHLQVLVISDPQTDKAAVSLDIDIGSNSNPANRPGLAHFLEHMLFLGTEKYPVPSDYSEFIQSHGGSQNAFTSGENTNYYFDIKEDALDEALDRFSQFFIAPLFAQKYTDRERNAVNAEYQSKLQDDGRRNYAAFKQIMNQQHPGSRFFVGSLDTLSDTQDSKIRDDLLQFYQQFYSANRMTLVVLGKSELSTLKALVVEKFSTLANHSVVKNTISVPRISPGQLPLILKVKTLKDFRRLTLSFPTAAAKDLYKLKPLSFISSLVGYEGRGSLMAHLKRLGYANGLSAGGSHSSELESSFQVSISLTHKGYENIDRVTESFFAFIEQLKIDGIREDLYVEEQRLSAQAFQFLTRQSPAHYVVSLSQTMREYPEQYWLNVPYLMQNFDQQRIESFLHSITADNMLMNIQAKDLTTDKTEAHFGAQYSVAKPSSQQLLQWQNPEPVEGLFVRQANPYIAENLSLQEQPQTTDTIPTKISLTAGSTLWHLQDSEFLTPKADIFFTLLMPDEKRSVKQQVALSLYASLLNDQFNEFFYDASSAGIQIQLYSHRRGISIRISGYSDKQQQIIEQLGTMVNTRFDQQRFTILKENYRRGLDNSLKEKPYQQLLANLTQLLIDIPSTEQKLQSLEQLQLADIYQLADNYFSAGELRILTHGNIQRDSALRLAKLIRKNLQIVNVAPITESDRLLKLQPGSSILKVKNIDHSDSALVLYLQGQDKSFQQQAATSLLAEIIGSRYYSELRTEQQLGYIVFASPMSLEKLPGLAFVVQSPTASPEQIESSNNQFLAEFAGQLAAIKPAELERYKQSIIARYNTQERNIYQRSARFWQQIHFNIDDFAEKETLITATVALNLEDILQSWKSLLSRKIQLQSHAQRIANK
ncbi:MAG: insulinase family protein [Pseudomonadales bacterium]|nr:insulinase family protein [Pseudomonadales bacterium]NRA17291.1 insulinase family protein [Oceanospirillaceae bacterium]